MSKDKLQPSRREFLKLFAVGLGLLVVDDLPDWMSSAEEENLPNILDLINACREVMDEELLEGWQEDMQSSEDFEEAIGLSFTLLIESGIDDPEQYLIDKNILL